MFRLLNLTRILASTSQASNTFKRLSSSFDLVDRNYLRPKDFSSHEIKSLMWTAMDLKERLNEPGATINVIKFFQITLLMHKPCLEIQGSVMSAANMLKAYLNVIIDPTWDDRDYIDDAARLLSTSSHMIFCQSKYQSKIEKFAKGSLIPVVSVRSCTDALSDTLADMMTLQEKYGGLKNLRMGWIGRPCPLINTYLCIGPRLGINMKYCCACAPGVGMSPAAWPTGMEHSKEECTSLKACDTGLAAIEKAHIIVMSKRAVRKFKLSLKQISEKADSNWSFLHVLPRGPDEVLPEVFDHENSLVWEAKGNLKWIYAALMVRLLRQYEHVTERPEFHKDVKSCP